MMSEQVWTAFGVVQIFFALVIGIYFIGLIKGQRQSKTKITINTQKEQERLEGMRKIQLSEPLTARTRPECFDDVIGQEEGIKALRAAMCGPNPQHVIIYGPPGVGKTTVARLVLEEAKRMEGSPFLADAAFIEIDGATSRFDERGIADPLIGSVHDPIYQGAGAMGVAGIPQPKPGAVTKAHGGVLYIDEIGELHPMQMNKLLKVLEDRKVQFESAYYNADDPAVPKHIHDIFKNGLPADFRLVGATTRSPEELPPALRSRCMEIYFRALDHDEIAHIAHRAAKKAGFAMSFDTAKLVARFASCGRDAVNMVQMASGVAQLEKRSTILPEDMEWVVESGHYPERPMPYAQLENRVGQVHGLAVQGAFQGAVMEIEAAVKKGTGQILVTGIVEEEEMGSANHTLRRKSTAHASAENVRTCLKTLGYIPGDKDVHINFPGGAPVDGPSAGLAMAVAAISALEGRPVDGSSAMTGEISVNGQVRPVGGVQEKVLAAKRAGLRRVLIPRENYLERFDHMEIQVIPVDHLKQALNCLLLPEEVQETGDEHVSVQPVPMVAAPAEGEMVHPAP